MKLKLILVFLIFASVLCSAQRLKPSTIRRGIVPLDTTSKALTKVTNHYFGVQANQLLNQLLNFGGSNVAINNPYLIIYSMNSIRSGWGLNAGLGYTTNTTSDNSDPNTDRKTTINDFSIRLGIERKVFLSRKWLASYGLDFLDGHQKDETTSSFKSQFSSNSTTTNSDVNTLGLGPRLSLSFLITEKIILGTEATYYYKSNKISQKISNSNSQVITDPNTGQNQTQQNFSSSSTSQKTSTFNFNVPLALFLIVKL